MSLLEGLFTAAFKGADVDTVRALLEVFADAASQPDDEGRLPLHLAAKSSSQLEVPIPKQTVVKCQGCIRVRCRPAGKRTGFVRFDEQFEHLCRGERLPRSTLNNERRGMGGGKCRCRTNHQRCWWFGKCCFKFLFRL